MPSDADSGFPAAQSRVQAVFWDMDGTLVDTEPYWIAAETQLVERFGGIWSEEHSRALVGNALPALAAALQQAGVGLEVRSIIDELIGAVVEQVHGRIPWRPGARELLEELSAAGIPTALVTMSEQRLAQEIVDQLPAGSFNQVVTGEMVSHGKPHPEPYLRAVGYLAGTCPQVDKTRIIALEDSVPGATSAQAAGLVTVAIPHIVPVPAHPGRQQWDTLAGKGLADLEALLSGRAGPDAAVLRGTA
jgi:HAD superfamily hydrolase (TIGR01509 family)